MTWTHYRLRFRLLSPMHIGYRKVGNLMQTRPYVPGKNVWAALTARLTRDYHNGGDAEMYKCIGRLVQENFRFGCLWPSTNKDAPSFPWEDPQFDYRFLGSYASTALNYDRRAAEEGLLRETEYIAPVARDGQPVYLVGDLWVREDDLPKALNSWQEAFQKFQLGGERTYGWGRVRCCTDWQAGQSRQGTTIAGYTWEERNDDVILTVPEGGKLTAHARAAGEDAISGVIGLVEPLVGWERNNASDSHSPWRLSSATVCWAPGSWVEHEVKVRIGENGIWEAF